MSHWAQLDGNKKVIQVTRGNNDDRKGDEGYSWLVKNLGGTWVKTSYNQSIRKNFAGVGFTYDEARDAFIPPKPFESWVLNEATCNWDAPTPKPLYEEGVYYVWDETTTSWVLDKEPVNE